MAKKFKTEISSCIVFIIHIPGPYYSHFHVRQPASASNTNTQVNGTVTVICVCVHSMHAETCIYVNEVVRKISHESSASKQKKLLVFMCGEPTDTKCHVIVVNVS